MKVFRVATTVLLLTGLAGCGAEPTASATASGASIGQSGSGAKGKSAEAQLNDIRRDAGRKPIKRSAKLDAAARAHVEDLVANGMYGHLGSNKSTPGGRVTKAGFRWCTVAENIGEGTKYNSESKIISGWARSPEHRKNILKPKVSAFGMATKNGVWVQVLAGSRC